MSPCACCWPGLLPAVPHPPPCPPVPPADGSAAYALVLPYPKRRFSPQDLQAPLAALGLQQRQLLLLEPLAGGAGGRGAWSVGGMLSSAASWLNPWAYLGGAAGTPREQAAAAAAEDTYRAAAEARRQGSAAPAQPFPAGDAQQRGARKRGPAPGGGAGPNIHTLHSGGSGGEGEGSDPEDNSYWNGNSTEFGAGPPPPPGQQ